MATIVEVLSPYEIISVPVDAVLWRQSPFPVPPLAVAFVTEVEEAVGPKTLVGNPPMLVVHGALFPQSDYLEITIGQIWPR